MFVKKINKDHSSFPLPTMLRHIARPYYLVNGLLERGRGRDKHRLEWLVDFIKMAKKRLSKDGAVIGLSGGMNSSICASVLKKSLKNKIIIKISLLFLKRNKKSYLWYILYLKRPISRSMNNPDTISPEWAIDCIKIGNIITDENYSIR